MIKKIKEKFSYFWHIVRQLSGDDAYERYLKHHAAIHSSALDEKPVLSRQAFFKIWQESKWKGIKRCC